MAELALRGLLQHVEPPMLRTALAVFVGKEDNDDELAEDLLVQGCEALKEELKSAEAAEFVRPVRPPRQQPAERAWRRFINRNRVGAHLRLMADYFNEDALYPANVFCRCFCMSKRLVE